MTDNDHPTPQPIKDYSKLAAVGMFIVCIAALLYMFTTGLDAKHDTMVIMLGMGAFLSAAKAL